MQNMTRLSYLVCVTFLLPLVSYGYSVDLEYGWGLEEVEVVRTGGYDYLGVEGSVYGDKSLGEIYEVRLLPFGYEVEGYEILREEWEEVGGGYRIGEILGLEMCEMGGDDLGGLEHVGSGDFMGYKVLVTAVRPLRVVGGRVSVLREFEMRVDCGMGEGGLRVSRRSEVTDGYLRGLMGDVLGEGLSVYGDWLVEGYKDWVSESPSTEGGVVDCVILTGESLRGEFERLAAWHDRMGVRTVVRTMEWLEGKYRGSDGPERVRNFLKDAYEKWGTVYVLLGGDPEIVPIRILNYPWLWVLTAKTSENLPSDVYYTNLGGDWNSDGDGIMGEVGQYNEDDVDLFPDVFIGRAPVVTVDDARTFVDKTLTYLQAEKAGTWPKRAVFLAQVLFDYLDGASRAEDILSHFPEDFETVKLYENYTAYPGALEETLENTLFHINQGCGIMSHIGHGDLLRLNLGTSMMYRWQIDSLTNDSAYCFVYMMNCASTNPLVETPAKRFIRNPHGGAFAVMGNPIFASAGYGLDSEEEFFRLLFENGDLTIGALSSLCRQHLMTRYSDSRWWMYLNNMLLGDPVVRLWTDEPGDYEVTDSGEMGLGDSLYVVEVREGGMVVEGAVVALLGERGEYGVGVTGSDGVASVSYRPKGLGWFDLVVSGENYHMYEDSVEVLGSGGRCYASSVVIDDGVGWVGNGDGEAGWGERVGLGVGLINGGVGLLSEVGCSLRVVSGCSLWVEVEIDSVVSDTLVYLGSGGIHPSGDPFGLVLSEEVLGRGLRRYGEGVGCWLWLDVSGWHIRFSGDGDIHSYGCSLEVYGELLGYKGNGLEAGDDLLVGGGGLSIRGLLGSGDYEDGIDIAIGESMGVEVHTDYMGYGSVGGSEVLGWYDVGFSGGGLGDGVGIWFELDIEDGSGGSWRDWIRVDIRDGEIFGERNVYEVLSGDSVRVYYGIRNVGGGGLVGVEGRLRGISGVEVLDSVSVYGDLSSGGYSEGEVYILRETGGLVSYGLLLSDAYGRQWCDTVEVRAVGGVSGLRHMIGGDFIELIWDMSDDSLFYGYDVYRSGTVLGPYDLVGQVDGYSRYVDGGLPSEEDYYYYVCVRDSMGNVSEPSETLETWTGVAYLEGWPVSANDVMPSSVTLSDLDRDGDLELIVGAKDERVYVWHHDGTLADGWPRRTGGEVWSSASAANLDDDDEFEIIIGSDDGDLYAWNLDGTGLKSSDGYFRSLNGQVRGAPALEDLDGDHDLEVVAGNTYSKVFVWHHNGLGYLQPNGVFAIADGGWIYGSPTICDLDGDEELEIIVASTGGNILVWNADGTGYLDSTGIFASPSGMFCSVAAGDVDNNGDMEIVIAGRYWAGVGVYDHTGTFRVGWPRSIDHGTSTSPALADLDGDNRLDIIVGTQRGVSGDTASVYVFAHNGELREGWPQRAADDFTSSPVAGDIDGDGQPAIVAATAGGTIYAWHADGTPVRGWPRCLTYSFYSTASLGDVDNDGDVEVVIAGYDGRVHVFDTIAPYDEDFMEWPNLCHDTYNTGAYIGPYYGADIPDRGDLIPPRLTVLGYPSPAVSSVNVRLGVPSTALSGKIFVDIYDVCGRHVKQIQNGVLEPGFHEIKWDGTTRYNREVSSGIYFVQVSREGESISRKVVLVR
jgi:hypothetical protein